MSAVLHWDDAPSEEFDLGAIGARWSELAGAAGARGLGVNRIQVPDGKAATPQHAEDEEIFYVLGGSGFSYQEDGCFAISAGDVVYYGEGYPAHTVIGGDEGLDVLAMGFSDMPPGVRFPRLGATRVGGLVVRGDTTHQWELETELGPIELPTEPDPRPDSIVNLADAPSRRVELGEARAEARFLRERLKAVKLALNFVRIDPGAESAPPHCHSHVEEAFVVLDGEGVLTLGDEEHPVRRGSVVARPAGTGVAHHFRAGDAGLEILMFSDTEPGDTIFYPRTGKVFLRGLGITIQPEIVPWA